MKNKLNKRLDFRVSVSLYERVQEIAKWAGFKNESEYIRSKIEKAVTSDEKKRGQQ